MLITMQYFDGCPNWRMAEARVRRVLAEAGREDVEIAHERVETSEDAERVGFHGSPTVLIDGRDPFEAEGPIGLACRVYRTEAGAKGAPSVEQLREVLLT